jgi:hypothetical protein
MISRILGMAYISGVLSLVACAVPVELQTTAIVLDRVNIVDVEAGFVRDGKSVLIEDGRIVEIADKQESDWPVAAQKPNVAGTYLSPALYDLHVHIFDERDLRLYALTGVQAVRNMDGWEWHLKLRDASMPTAGPRARLFTVGRQFQKPLVTTPADVEAGIAQERAAGYDWIKLYDNLDTVLLAAVAESAGDNSRITGHLPDNVALSTVLAAGVYDDVAHTEELMNKMRHEYGDWETALDDVAKKMKSQSIALTTTIVMNKMIADQVADIEANLNREQTAYAPPILQVFWQSSMNPWGASHDADAAQHLADQVENLKRITAELHARGVTILAGTDASNPTTVPAFSLHEELVLLVEAGLSPLEALRSATTSAADHVEPASRGARIERGAAANFILTRDNPLEEISVLQDFDALIVDGTYLSRDSIDAERAALRDRYAQDIVILTHLAPDSPAAVFEAIEASEAMEPISREGLTSLVWFYVKVGNLDAAVAVAEKLAVLHPSQQSEYVKSYMSRLIEQ